MATQPAHTHLFDHMTVLADPIRCRLLGLLEQHALAVSDLCAVLQLPQSTVSRHLKALADVGWLTSSPDGTRRLYRGTVEQLPDAARDLASTVEQTSKSIQSMIASVRGVAESAGVLSSSVQETAATVEQMTCESDRRSTPRPQVARPCLGSDRQRRGRPRPGQRRGSAAAPAAQA